MRKSVFVLAVIAAACSSVAFAGEVKQGEKAPTVKATVMSDSDMDKVTAGSGAVVSGPGPGVIVTLPGQASDTATSGGIGHANFNAGANPATLQK